MAEPLVPHWHVVIKPFPAELMSVRNFEISPALLGNSLGYRLLIREQTSRELLVLELRRRIVSGNALPAQGA